VALYNEILVGRFNQFIKRWMNFKGQAPAPQLASEIVPGFVFFSGNENRFNESWYRYALGVQNAAVAGLTTAMRFRNPGAAPGGSSVIAVLESVRLWEAAADSVIVLRRGSQPDVNLSTAVPGNPQERRIPTFSNSIVSLDLAGSQVGIQAFHVELAAGVETELIQTEPQEIVVDPGDWIQFASSLANTAFRISFRWRERSLEPSELGI